jgi:hypothetical protein
VLLWLSLQPRSWHDGRTDLVGSVAASLCMTISWMDTCNADWGVARRAEVLQDVLDALPCLVLLLCHAQQL